MKFLIIILSAILLSACTTVPKVVNPAEGAVDAATKKLADEGGLRVWVNCNQAYTSSINYEYHYIAFVSKIYNYGNKKHTVSYQNFKGVTKNAKKLPHFNEAYSAYDCYHDKKSTNDLRDDVTCKPTIELNPGENVEMRKTLEVRTSTLFLPSVYGKSHLDPNSSIKIDFAKVDDKIWGAQCNTL